MNSSGWATRFHLILRPPTPFNMSLPLLLSLRIALFLHLLSAIPSFPLCTYLNHSISPSPQFYPFPVFLLLVLTFSSLVSLLSPIPVFLPCFPDHEKVMECKLNVAMTFWASAFPLQALSHTQLSSASMDV